MSGIRLAALVMTIGLGGAVPAQAKPPPASWAQDGFGPGNTSYNPTESVINAGSIGRLKLRWTVASAPGAPGCRPDPLAPLAVDDRVFRRDASGVAGYDAASGKQLWRNASAGTAAALIAAGNLILVFDGGCYSASSYGSSVTALDAGTGARRWTRSGGWTIDTAVADAGTVVTSGYCGTCEDAQHGVNAYRLTDGALLWSRPGQVLAGPVSAGGLVLLRETTGGAETWASRISTGKPLWGTSRSSSVSAASPDGTRFYIRDDDSLCARLVGNGKPLWKIPKETGDLAADDRYVYVASAGRMNTYDAKNGRLVWTRALASPREPVRAGGLLYVLYGKGSLAVLTPADGRPVAAKATYSGLSEHVVPAGGRLLISGESSLRAYAP
ncbi:PQQ-binding-like beta-propeller repeat protein [Actinoplanes sp. NPDC026619]|uniref:outer membrane protein assembly factor BamB family protein n=1 Tax=Actinoplanes sp. NPDC026619 TaxID=3155798 RepID=UPI003409A62B